MITRIEAAGICTLASLAVALALMLSLIGCATGPLGSRGVDYVPGFGGESVNAL